MHARPPKLLDVARLAGVGKTTASDALSGTGRVSAETRAAVLAAANELNYVPNGAARHLRRASTGAVAMVLSGALSRSNYYMSFVFGVVAEAAAHDYDVAIVSPTDRGLERPIRADGIIISDPHSGDPFVQSVLESRLPVITCERIPGEGPEPDGVVWSAHEAGMLALLTEVARSGARRPALIVADDSVDWSRSLQRGYRTWCEDAGIEPVIATVGYEATWVQIREAAARLLGEHPEVDALICGPDGSASEIMPLLPGFGREVGRNFALASCVDSAPMQMVTPTITSLDLRPREAGAACARLLFEVLDGTAATGTAVEHAITLVPRASTEPFLLESPR